MPPVHLPFSELLRFPEMGSIPGFLALIASVVLVRFLKPGLLSAHPGVSLAVVVFWLYLVRRRARGGRATTKADLRDKVVVVTGANTGAFCIERT